MAVPGGLGAVALIEVLRMRDGWTGAPRMPALVGATLAVLGGAHRWMPAAVVEWPDAAGARRVVGVMGWLALQQEKLKKYLPLATKMGIRK
jgi:hypothetical protein